MQDEKSIRITSDGRAVYEHVRILPGEDGAPERRHVCETKTVDATALIPQRGALYLTPPRCRFMVSEGVNTVIVTEDTPCVRTVSWATDFSEVYDNMKNRMLADGLHRAWGESREEFSRRLSSQRRFQLAFPFIVICHKFVQDEFSYATLYYRKAPLRTEHDELLISNLPNQRRDTAVLCLTDAVRAMRRDGRSFTEMLEFIQQEFWNSPWNRDWTEQFTTDAVRLPEVASPWEWERSSLSRPLFALQTPWRPTERTIGQEVRRLLYGRDDGEASIGDAFRFFLKSVREADDWDHTPQKTDQGYRISPAHTLVLRDINLSIGDVLEYTDGYYRGWKKGEPRAIEWFGMNQGDVRLVKLVDVSEPLPLISNNRLNDGCKRVEAAGSEEAILIQGMPLVPGCLIRFLDQHSWPNKSSDNYYQISHVRRDVSGSIQARFIGDNGYFTLLGQGDTLYPGLKLLPPEKTGTNGLLEAREVTLSDGTVLKVGDLMFIRSDGGLRVESIRGFYSHSRYSRQAYVGNESGASYYCAEEDDTLCADVTPYRAVQVLRFGDLSVHVGKFIIHNGKRVKVLALCAPTPRGDRTYVKLANGWRSLGSARVLADGFCLPQSAFVKDGALCFGQTRIECGAWFRVPETGALKQASGFKISPGRDQAIVIWTDNTTRKALENYQPVKPVLMPAWLRLRLRPGLSLQRGQRLRLKRDASIYKRGQRFVISHLELAPDGGPKPLVYLSTGVNFQLTDQVATLFETRLRDHWIDLAPAGMPMTDEPLITCRQWTRVKQYRKNVHAPRCVERGRSVGIDNRDRELKIGDVVTVVDPDKACTGCVSHVIKLGDKHEYIVVHGEQHSSDNPRGWLYLESCVYLKQAVRRHAFGFDLVPVNLRQDASWWQGLVYVRSSGCLFVRRPETA